jgi:hypothetical protein
MLEKHFACTLYLHKLLVISPQSLVLIIQRSMIYPFRAKRFELVTIVIALVSAVIAASVATIFTAVELDRLRAKQQKADTVAKLGLMASKETSNSQVELIRLTLEVVNALNNAWGNIDTIQHVLLVCNVADKQVGVMESAMQVAMGGHLSVAAFTELNYARVALKTNRDAKAAGLEPVARHLFALFARRFELARETSRTTIGGTESAMRMVSPNSFGSYNDAAH